jgi:biopolymer transport protein ExbB/TolQ
VAEITVDIAAVAELARRLQALAQEFDAVDDVVRGYHDAVGSSDVAAALDDFAGNWSRERKKIRRQMEEVAGYADAAAEAYASIENEISGACQTQGG